MAFQLQGILHEKFNEQQVSEKFRKRELVIEVQGTYPEHIKFQLVQDRCDILDPFNIGDEVMVDFNLRGRGFNKNGQMLYFTNLEAWKIQYAGAQAQQPRPNVPPARASQPQAAAPIASDDDNDLPF